MLVLQKDKLFVMMNYKDVKAWPFEEARKILKKINGKTPQKGYVLFETGYGPSGLPHIGTFGEVVRTCFVKYAFEQIAPEIPTRLMCISDDFDGLRKVPTNIPNREMVASCIGLPLTKIPDPFGTHESYGHNMNSRLRAFLDGFNFKYEFVSATEKYFSGRFNETILKVVEKYDELMDLMLANLGEERQETYSPLMPICQKTGKILASGVKGVDKKKGTVIFVNEFGEEVEQDVCDGRCKLQWKIDFGARWRSFEVDYEIFGKDHLANEKIYKSVCKILGGNSPETFSYELFLGEDGAKISKSKGNGISVEEWLEFAPPESLALFMFQKPKTAKRLYFDVIPKAVDEYIIFASKYHTQNEQEKLENPAYYIHFGLVPEVDLGAISYSLLLNLSSACSPENPDILWGFIKKYNPELTKGRFALLDKMVEKSLNYYNKFVKPFKEFKHPNEAEKKAISEMLVEIDSVSTGEGYQNVIYNVARGNGFEPADFFLLIYQVALGQKSGPRLGSFILIFGLQNFKNLFDKALAK